MATIIDRSNEPSNGTGSQERLRQRVRGPAREAIHKALSNGKATDIGTEGIRVPIPKDLLSEPHFIHGPGGIQERTIPGNNNEQARHSVGDIIGKSGGGGGDGDGDGKGGNEGADGGGGEDDFIYISPKESMEILAEELELPNMVKAGIVDDQNFTIEPAGFAHTGTQNRMDLMRSKMAKTAREIAMNRRTYLNIENLLTEKRDILTQYGPTLLQEPAQQEAPQHLKQRIKLLRAETDELAARYGKDLRPKEKKRVSDIDALLPPLYEKARAISRWDQHNDLRYHIPEQVPLPIAQAVMFCEMDVSGSMGEEMKSNAKLFYFLLYNFLTKHYKNVDVVWIRYTDTAKEVSEKEFFESRETGGTVVSSAHELVLDVQNQRYPTNKWNIYGAGASDGDNYSSDSRKTAETMKQILPLTQGYFHIEVANPGLYNTRETELWNTYLPLASEFNDRFWMKKVKERRDVWPVFVEFFKKRTTTDGFTSNRASALNLG